MPAAAGMQFVNGKFKFNFFTILKFKTPAKFYLQPFATSKVHTHILCIQRYHMLFKTEIRSIEFAFETSTCVSLASVAPMPARQCPCSNLRMDL